ncbi:MAG: PAS domain-containing protein [Cryomorphaceae bacterium]
MGEVQRGKLIELEDQNKLNRLTSSIVFYNAEQPEIPNLLKTSSSNQFIAIAECTEKALRAAEKGATDCIQISTLNKASIQKSLILANRLMRSNSRLNQWKRQVDLLLEQAYDSILVQDDRNEIIFASPSTERLFGKKSEEMIGKDALTFIHSDDREDLRNLLFILDSDNENSLKCKCRVISGSGGVIWVEATVTNYIQNPDITGFIINLRDINDEYEAEKSLSLTELKYRTLVESTSDGVWHYDLENDEVLWSDSLYRILGYNQNEGIKPNHIPDLAHPDDREKILNGLQDRVYKGLPYESEFRIRKKDGKYIWVRAEGNGLKNGKGEVILILGAIKNVDARKRAEIDLELSKNRIENIANGINGVLARHREYPNGRVENLYISSGVKEIWGITAEEVIADPEKIWLSLEEVELKKLETAFYEAVKNEVKLDHIYSIRDEEGKKKFLHVVALPKKMRDGTIEWDSITTDVTSIKNAQEKSQEQQLLLENIIYNIDGAVQRYKIDENGKGELLFVSNGFEKLTGIPVEDAMQNFDLAREQIPPEDRLKIQQAIEHSIKHLTEWEETWRITDRSGNLKWIQGSGISMKKPDGSVVTDSVITDITKLKEATAELTSKKQEFKLAAKAALLGLWKFDPVKDILEWDEQMFKVFGIDPEEFTGKRQEWIDVLHPDDKTKSINALADAVNTGTDLDFQFRIKRRDTQEIRHIRASANSVVDDNGNTLYLVGLNWDVTHIVRAQEKLTESNNRYALASRATQDAIWDLDLKTNVLKWSPSFNEIFDHNIYLEKDHLEKWGALVHPDDHDRVVIGLNDFIATGKNKWEEKYRFKKGNGEYAHVLDRGYIVRDYTGKATRMVGSMRDITANTEYLNAIKAQNEKLKKIAWLQSHELRGPLTRIMGLADLVKQDGFKDVTIDEFLTYLNSAAYDLDQVIREIVEGSEEVGIYDPKEKRVLKNQPPLS